MGLIERLKETYESGQRKRRLNEQVRIYHLIEGLTLGDSSIRIMSEDATQEKKRIKRNIEAIPKPDGFLEKIAYSLGELSYTFSF